MRLPHLKFEYAQRSENLPSDIELVVSDKVAVISLEGIENESFVGLCRGSLFTLL